jgi:hypothetical protein
MEWQEENNRLYSNIEKTYRYFGNSPQQREMNFSHAVVAFLLILAGLLHLIFSRL